MKLAHQDRLLLLAVMLSAIVLIVLGALQIRWSRQVSQAARERIGTTLKAAMLDWHLDLLRQLSAPALALSTAIDAHEPLTHYLEEYEEWTDVAPHPDLVADIFALPHAAGKTGKTPELLRLNPATGSVESADWPANMEHLHQILKSPSDLPEALGPPPVPPPGVRRTDAPNEWLFDPHIPALVYAAGCGEAGPQRAVSQCVIITFNSQVLEKTILPELAQRYFGSSGGTRYQVAVIGELSGQQTVYTSNANFDQDDFRTAESRMNIFGPRRPRPAPPDKESSASFRPEATMSSMQRGSWRDFAAPVWFNVIRYTPADRDWYLMVTPLQGSLEGMVAQAQRRDLSVGFGVLLLLTISTLMVILTSRRAQNLARMQMQFISAVSHELRTPLAVICSAADNLADGVIHGEQQLSQYRSMIATQARQLTGLMEQVLSFAASGELKPQYHLRVLQISEIIAATVEKTAGLIEDAEFKLEQYVEPGLPPVLGDVDALSQCLQNLIVNAVKYSGESRWIGLRATIAENASKKEIQISVADRGIGIKSSEMNRIFQPFYRSPSVVAAQVHGTGLGLSLAANIAQAMNGRLTVSSTPGEGSIFTLHLPIFNNILRQDLDQDQGQDKDQDESDAASVSPSRP